MRFSWVSALLSLALLGLEAGPVSPKSDFSTLEQRGPQEKINWEVAHSHGLPQNADPNKFYAFEMKSQAKVEEPADLHAKLNQLTTDKGGYHSRLVVGYISAQQEFTAECFHLSLKMKGGQPVPKDHPNGNGMPVNVIMDECAWPKELKSTLTYKGEVKGKQFQQIADGRKSLDAVEGSAMDMLEHWGPKKDGKYDADKANCFDFTDQLWEKMNH